MRKLFAAIMLILLFSTACVGTAVDDNSSATDAEKTAGGREGIAGKIETSVDSYEGISGVYAGYALVPIGDEILRYRKISSDLSGVNLSFATDELIFEWGEGGIGHSWRFYEMEEYPEHDKILGLGPEGGIFEVAPFHAVDKSEIEAVAMSDAVLLVNGSVESGQELWNAFYSMVDNHMPTSIIIGYCYTQSKNLSYDLAVATDGDYPSLYLNKITYDGCQFVIEPVHRVDGEYVVQEIEGYDSPTEYFKYLRHFEGEARFPFMTYSYYDIYILTDNDTATLEEMEDSRIVNYDEAIWYREVYGEYTWKDNAPFLPLQ
ncbi:MAG: hypothetical protein K5679_02600 [Lachnospiraceae bacterium]|nr:hypothetical protein [Lachnospiraceae bacterium]